MYFLDVSCLGGCSKNILPGRQKSKISVGGFGQLALGNCAPVMLAVAQILCSAPVLRSRAQVSCPAPRPQHPCSIIVLSSRVTSRLLLTIRVVVLYILNKPAATGSNDQSRSTFAFASAAAVILFFIVGYISRFVFVRGALLKRTCLFWVCTFCQRHVKR